MRKLYHATSCLPISTPKRPSARPHIPSRCGLPVHHPTAGNHQHPPNARSPSHFGTSARHDGFSSSDGGVVCRHSRISIRGVFCSPRLFFT
ncbi:hypothetical protein K456DRAFT_850093 [Colletotrichum gloeosporioides 23]|nr:hypothetical protein K456DRAFT_850093 [Colletotrichum gloeosporioides 23]